MILRFNTFTHSLCVPVDDNQKNLRLHHTVGRFFGIFLWNKRRNLFRYLYFGNINGCVCDSILLLK